jgi:hypothetical protein
VLAKMECLNPGGLLKDRPVPRMVPSATTTDDAQSTSGAIVDESRAYESREFLDVLSTRMAPAATACAASSVGLRSPR